MARNNGSPPSGALGFPVEYAGLVHVISAHGGAGSTTLCRWLGSQMVQDWGMAVPPQLVGASVVVTCLGTAHGSARACELVKYLCEVTERSRIIVVVTGDGRGLEPPSVKSRLRMLSAHVEAIVKLPFITRWRYLDDPLEQPAPPGYSQQLHHLRQILGTSQLIAI